MGEGKAQWLEMKNIDSCAQQRGLGQVTHSTPPSPSLLISKTELIILTLPVYGEN